MRPSAGRVLLLVQGTCCVSINRCQSHSRLKEKVSPDDAFSVTLSSSNAKMKVRFPINQPQSALCSFTSVTSCLWPNLIGEPGHVEAADHEDDGMCFCFGGLIELSQQMTVLRQTVAGRVRLSFVKPQVLKLLPAVAGCLLLSAVGGTRVRLISK